ncbi:MAG: tripartite tricarboxylate transporter substrate-binding protein, partial [Chromatiales bacterium]
MLTSVLLLLLLTSESPALEPTADGYPAQPLTILVPRDYGGASYQVSVAMAAALQRVVGTPVRVVTRPQSKGLEALDEYQSIPPNGYTILENQDLLFSQFLKGEIALDPVRDLTPLALTLAYSQLYVRANETRFADLPGLVKCVDRHNPGCSGNKPLRISLFGKQGDTEDLLLSALARELGLHFQENFITVPADRYLSLLNGDADLLIEQPGDVRMFLERSLIKPIFSFQDRQIAAYPTVPRDANGNLQLPDLPRIRGFFVHPETPTARLDYLRRAFAEAVHTDEFQAYARQHYISPEDILTEPARAEAFMDAVLQTYRQMIDT